MKAIKNAIDRMVVQRSDIQPSVLKIQGELS